MTVTGNNVVVFTDVEGYFLPYACARSCSKTDTTEVIETSVSGSGLWATFLPTKNSFTISIDGLVSLDEAGSLVLSDLRQMQYSHTILFIRYQLTDDSNNVYAEEGYGYITSSTATGNFDDMATFSVEIQGTGAITQNTES